MIFHSSHTNALLTKGYLAQTEQNRSSDSRVACCLKKRRKVSSQQHGVIAKASFPASRNFPTQTLLGSTALT